MGPNLNRKREEGSNRGQCDFVEVTSRPSLNGE